MARKQKTMRHYVSCPECGKEYPVAADGDGYDGTQNEEVFGDYDGSPTITLYKCNDSCVGIVAVSVQNDDGEFYFIPSRHIL